METLLHLPNARKQVQNRIFSQQSLNSCQHEPCFSPRSLQSLICTYFWHFSGSKWSLSEPQVGQSRAHFGLQMSRTSWGVALGAQKAPHLCQDRPYFSPPSPQRIQALFGPKWPPSEPQVGQSRAHVGLQMSSTSWGVALGAQKAHHLNQDRPTSHLIPCKA